MQDMYRLTFEVTLGIFCYQYLFVFRRVYYVSELRFESTGQMVTFLIAAQT